MEEKKLCNLALFCSLIGLLILFFISTQIEVAQINIREIGPDDIGKNVKICGFVESKRTSNGHIFLELKDNTGKINFVIFNQTASNLKKNGIDLYNLKNNGKLCGSGTVDEYPKGSGNLEIIYKKGIEIF